MNKFIGRLFIEGDIRLLTGLHIGGSRETVEIGGLDNPVIKTIEGIPYIPGSSLKGKIRCLLERARNINSKEGEPCGCGKCEVCLLFGSHNDKTKTLSRVIIRDSFLDQEDFKNNFGKYFDRDIEYTEEKTENIIDRIAGTARYPRTMERVPAGAKFKFSSSIAFYEDDDVEKLVKTFVEGMRMLEDDYLGGSGTRGYGHIKFENLSFYVKPYESYYKDNQRKEIRKSVALTDKDIVEVLVKELKEVLKK